MNFIIIIFFICILLSSCFLLAYFGEKWNLKAIASLGSGALLSICFLDFLPQSFQDHQSHDVLSFCILTGILIQALADIYILPKLKFLDNFFIKKQTNKTHSHSHVLNLGSVCSIVGCLSLCSFFDGIRLFSSLVMDKSVGFAMLVALFFHLLSEGVLVAALALSSGIKKRALLALVSCLSGSLLLGALLAQFLFISFSEKYVLAFSSGILTYICFVHLLPFSLKHKNILWFFAGLILFSVFHLV